MASAIFVAVSGKESIVCAVIPCSLVKIFLRVRGTSFLASDSWEEEVAAEVPALCLQVRVCVCVCDLAGRIVCSRTQFRSVSAV
jgi:hypothetical protein